MSLGFWIGSWVSGGKKSLSFALKDPRGRIRGLEAGVQIDNGVLRCEFPGQRTSVRFWKGALPLSGLKEGEAERGGRGERTGRPGEARDEHMQI